MVHNGIEYGDMQLICEVYHMMKDILKMSNKEMADVRRKTNFPTNFSVRHFSFSKVFDEWNKGTLDSFLIEITANILRFEENGKSTVDSIRDAAGQVRFYFSNERTEKHTNIDFRKERANGRASLHSIMEFRSR